MCQTSVKKRLADFLKYMKMGQARFALKAGLSRGYVNNIVNTIGPEARMKIASAFPDLNTDWLLTGEGEMLNRPDSLPGSPVPSPVPGWVVPLLPISAQGGTLNDFVAAVRQEDCEKIASPIRGMDFALTVSGDSMAPEYPSGCKVLVQKIDRAAFIEWGRVYVLDTCNGSVVKKIMPGDREGSVRCVSINDAYPPFDVELASVFGIYRVRLMLAEK